jgi:hypothetical protein
MPRTLALCTLTTMSCVMPSWQRHSVDAIPWECNTCCWLFTAYYKRKKQQNPAQLRQEVVRAGRCCHQKYRRLAAYKDYMPLRVFLAVAAARCDMHAHLTVSCRPKVLSLAHVVWVMAALDCTHRMLLDHDNGMDGSNIAGPLSTCFKQGTRNHRPSIRHIKRPCLPKAFK